MKKGVQAAFNVTAGFGLNMFSCDELYNIHLATLDVLYRCGVKVHSSEAQEIMDGGGCIVDPKTGMVRFPSWVVEEAIRWAPPKVVLWGRDPAKKVVLEGTRVHFTNFGEGIMMLDPFTGEYRKSTKEDVAWTALMADALDEIDVYERAVSARDMHPEVAPLHEAEAYFSNTTKPCFQGPGSGWLAKKQFAMAAAVAGGMDRLRARPVLSTIVCPTSPLQLTPHCCEVIVESARHGVPVNVLSMAMAGGSSPVTLAGTLVTHNAEVLSGIVLAQLTAKGTPVIYGSSTTMMDLRTATAPVGAPETGMINAAVARLAQFYLLPSWVAGG
jgi:trimethylamine--corrinoid protein Co-methyltransferase